MLNVFSKNKYENLAAYTYLILTNEGTENWSEESQSKAFIYLIYSNSDQKSLPKGPFQHVTEEIV